jgi:hypothetical protein
MRAFLFLENLQRTLATRRNRNSHPLNGKESLPGVLTVERIPRPCCWRILWKIWEDCCLSEFIIPLKIPLFIQVKLKSINVII